jgi:hypothetical protein
LDSACEILLHDDTTLEWKLVDDVIALFDFGPVFLIKSSCLPENVGFLVILGHFEPLMLEESAYELVISINLKLFVIEGDLACSFHLLDGILVVKFLEEKD